MHRYYTVSETYHHPDGFTYVGYGIACIEGENARQIECAEDISCDGAAVAALTARINEEDLSPLHLYDVVEDWLYEQELSPNFGTAPKD